MSKRLHLFGSPKVDVGDQTYALPFERRGQLIALLALKRGWVGRSDLAAMFWPDQAAKLAYANLRKILFRLQALPFASDIETQGSAVRLAIATDVADFEAALRDGRTADALTMRRGELLAGFDDGQSEAWSGWLNFERERLRTAWRSAALEHLAGDIEPGAGVDLSAQLLEADPLDEAALRAHMLWLARHGQSTRARHSYQAFVTRLADELGLAPRAELKALHDTLGAAVVAAIPVAAGLPAGRDDGFVGRTIELRRITELLAQDTCQLVNVIGPGGMGKTRFAHHACRELASRFADGALFVPLEDVAAASDVGGRLARELDIGVVGSADPFAKSIEHLRERQMLLVFDNFEHLVAAAPQLDRLLLACPGIKCIVTSRVRLGIEREWLLRLDGLPCPELDDADHLETFDAARLFIKAAQRVEPGLVPAAEAAAIVDICRQLEGVPLALELAAAWTRVLSCAAIAAELRRSAELLSAADDVPPTRHASIEAVFEQSWQLLSPVERESLARLSVFRGGFTAEAARAVTGAALPVLGALADKSLLRKDDARLHLHALVHQFAAARLDNIEGRTTTEAAHARYFSRLLTQLERGVENGDRDTMRLLDDEFENCRNAFQWAIAHDAIEPLKACKPALMQYCDHRCRFDDALALMQSALASPVVQADAPFFARVLARTAQLTYRLDRYAEAEAIALRALSAARSARSYRARSLALGILGSCCLRQGRYENALRYYRQGLEAATAQNDVHNAAVALDHIALVEKWRGNYGEAVNLSLQSLAAHRRLGDVAGEALCHNSVASSYLARHDYASAGTHLREGLALCDREGLVGPRLYILANLTEVAIHDRDSDAAERYARRGIEAATAAGNRPVVAWLKLQFAQLDILRGDLPAARAAIAGSLAISTVLMAPSLMINGLMVCAEIIAAQGEPEVARRLLDFAAGHPSSSVPHRAEIEKRLAALPATTAAVPAWPDIGLEELLDRIAGEADVAYRPLIASLRNTR